MADRHLAQALLKQIGKFVAGRDAVKVGRVFLLHLLDVESVIVRVIEEIALDAPGFVIDLLPHGAGLNVDFPSIEFERTKARLGRARSGRTIVNRSGGP